MTNPVVHEIERLITEVNEACEDMEILLNKSLVLADEAFSLSDFEDSKLFSREVILNRLKNIAKIIEKMENCLSESRPMTGIFDKLARLGELVEHLNVLTQQEPDA